MNAAKKGYVPNKSTGGKTTDKALKVISSPQSLCDRFIQTFFARRHEGTTRVCVCCVCVST